jgi:hypothetical protein
MKMNPRVKVLKQLVADGHYVIDESAVADAVLLRSAARQLLPDVTFRGAPRGAPPVRSFRPHRGATSFRLTQRKGRRQHVGSGMLPLSI